MWLSRDDREVTSAWQRLKREPKRPTTTRLREHIAHVRWLQSLNTGRQSLDGMPDTTSQRFANEAQALNITRMHEIYQPKRCTLAVALGRIRAAHALDDLAEKFIRLPDRLRVVLSISQGKVRVFDDTVLAWHRKP